MAPVDAPKTRPSRSLASRLKRGILFLLILLIPLAGLGFFQVNTFLTTAVAPEKATTRFVISPGETLTGIARQLEEQHLIDNALFFRLYVRYKGAAGALQAGEYLFNAPHTPSEILAILQQGKVKLYRLTLPEGLNIRETAAAAARAGFCTQAEFIALCKNPAFIKELGISARSLEGYLYPDTYFFARTADCKQVIKTMTRSLDQVFTPAWKERAQSLGFTPHEILTLASIIEKETGKAFERPVIASVFHNRLKKGMKLQSDPTVIYGDPDFKGRIRTRHLRRKTPYNTYVIKGLPPGPIANPGAHAIEAALYPDRTDYLYFVSKNNMTHQFSRTLKEHNRAVRKYQLGK